MDIVQPRIRFWFHTSFAASHHTCAEPSVWLWYSFVDATNLVPGLSDSGNHAEWNLRGQCERLNKELHTVKRHNQDLKNAYEMSKREYKHVCDARLHTQTQLNMAKTDMENLKVWFHYFLGTIFTISATLVCSEGMFGTGLARINR